MDYGFTSTDSVEYSKRGMPIGEYHVRVADEYVSDKITETNPNAIILDLEILDGEFKGQTTQKMLNVHNVSDGARKAAHESIKRIADATKKAVTPATPIKGRIFKVIVGPQKKNPDYTDIQKYLPSELPF